jgi:hypothetical protein
MKNNVPVLYSLFAENGVIVRNLNYRPWQWVYSISGCKSFPGGFLFFSLNFHRNYKFSLFFKVRKSSSVALESTSINFIFFRTYYLFNKFIKNRQENKVN